MFIFRIILGIQTRKRTQKANFAENKVSVLQKKRHLNGRCMFTANNLAVAKTLSEARGRNTAKVNVCGVAKRSPQKVRGKRRALNRAVLNHPDQLVTHMETATIGKVLELATVVSV